MIKSLRAPPPPAGKPAPPTAAARAEDHVATVLDGSATTWARIKAASDLGREIETIRRQGLPVGGLAAGAAPLMDALLELVGYASKQQRLWQVWSIKAPPPGEATARPAPPGAELTVADARTARQNCATVLGLVELLAAGDRAAAPSAREPLRHLPAEPESVLARAKVMRHALARKKRRARDELNRELAAARAEVARRLASEAADADDADASDGGDAPEDAAPTEDAFFDAEAALAALNAASDPDRGVEAKVEAVERSQPKPGTVTMSHALAAYVQKLDARAASAAAAVPRYDHRRSVARANAPGGYVRTRRGAYRAAAAPPPRRRPMVAFLDDVAAPRDLARAPLRRSGSAPGAPLDADAALGYRAPQLVVAAPRPRPSRGDPLAVPPRARDAVERARRPATSDAVLDEYERVAALRTYAGMALRDPAHPRAAALRALLPDAARAARRPAWLEPALAPLARPPALTATAPPSLLTAAAAPARPTAPLALATSTTTTTTTLAAAPLSAEAPPAEEPLVAVSAASVERAVAWTPRRGARPTPPATLDGGSSLGRGTSLWSASSPSRAGAPREAMSPPAVGGWDSYAAREARRTAVDADAPEAAGGALPAALALYDGGDDERRAVARVAAAEARAGARAAAGAPPAFRPAVAAARAERKEATRTLRRAAAEAKAAWRAARTRAIVQHGPVEAWAPDDDAAMARVAASRDVMLRAEAKAAATHRVEAHARVDAQLRALPLRLLASAFCGGATAAAAAAAVRDRLRAALGRWVEEFERAQRTAALALWRVAGLELRRAEARVAYARHAGAQKLGRFLARCRRRGATRCLHKWVSRTGWAIFFERAAGALRVQTCYRRARERARFVAAHDANPLYAFAAVALGEARAAADCAFRLDDRVRAERREMWFAATVIQARQRRNEWRGYYLLALRAATVFVALYRMWPVRRRYARLRNAAICVEASAHMFLARRPFLRARAAARTVARTVRGHLGRLRAAGARAARRRAREDAVVAPRTAQRYLRGCLAREAVAAHKRELAKEERCALRLQCAWYRNRDAFTTFLLLGCLRTTDEDDKAHEKLMRRYMRGKAATLVKKRHGAHRGRVANAAARRVQGAWLRYDSHDYVMRLRRQKWARRKIRCFLTARMNHRHDSSRRIAFCWWRALPGRFLRHLEHAIARFEAGEERLEAAAREDAAATIQAVINGQLTRARLRNAAAAVTAQTAVRGWQARLAARARRERRKETFVGRAVDRPLRDALLSRLNDYRRALHVWAAPIQARGRGWLTRSALRRVERAAGAFAVAAATIQRTQRSRARLALARAAVAAAKRARLGAYRSCGAVADVLGAVASTAGPPAGGAEPWLWFSPADPWAGVTAGALARRAGRPEAGAMLANRRISTLRQLADHRRRAGRLSARQEADEDALAECASLARAVLRRAAGEGAADGDAAALEAARPLRGDERPRAILEVCALRFGNLSRRRRDAGDASGVELAALPRPCQALVKALADGDRPAPRDLSRAAYARFVARHGDAARALQALEDGELGGPPWAASKAERDADDKRIRETLLHGRVALEKCWALLEEREGALAADGLLGSTVLSALADGAAVREVAAERSAAAAKALARAEAEARQRAEQKDALKRLSAENGGGGARAAKARTAKGAGRKPDARKR